MFDIGSFATASRSRMLTLALILFPGCAADAPREPDRPAIHGPWRWVGSRGGIVGIHLTPAAEGYGLTFYFHHDGRLRVYRSGSLQADVPFDAYSAASARPAPPGDSLPIRRNPVASRNSSGHSQRGPPPTTLSFDDPLTVFPFDPGIDRQSVRASGPDTLLLADPCCHGYTHALVRID